MPNAWDLPAFGLITSVFVAIAERSRQIAGPLSVAGSSGVSLDYRELPHYALRTNAGVRYEGWLAWGSAMGNIASAILLGVVTSGLYYVFK